MRTSSDHKSLFDQLAASCSNALQHRTIYELMVKGNWKQWKWKLEMETENGNSQKLDANEC